MTRGSERLPLAPARPIAIMPSRGDIWPGAPLLFMRGSLLSVPALMAVVLGVSWPRTARAVAWTFDSVTYTPPDGFAPILGGPADRADWKRVDGDSFCEIVMFWAADATMDAGADHAFASSRTATASTTSPREGAAAWRSTRPSSTTSMRRARDCSGRASSPVCEG